jgi:hypothetical protein
VLLTECSTKLPFLVSTKKATREKKSVQIRLRKLQDKAKQSAIYKNGAYRQQCGSLSNNDISQLDLLVDTSILFSDQFFDCIASYYSATPFVFVWYNNNNNFVQYAITNFGRMEGIGE